jgi:hypothetical protein
MPTQETKQAALSVRRAVLPVEEVVEIIREWVEFHARHCAARL